MSGVEIAVGYLFGRALREVRPGAGQAEPEADRALDAGVERLYAVVCRALGDNAALRSLTEEAEAGRTAPTRLTSQRLRIALEDAAWSDPAFAGALRAALAGIPTVPGPGGVLNGPSTVQIGDGSR